MLHAHFLSIAIRRSQKRCVENTVLDITTRKFKFLCKEADIHILCQRGVLGNRRPPQHLSGIRIGELEFHNVFHTPEESGVNIVFVVGGQHGYSVIGLNLLQKQRSLVVIGRLVTSSVIGTLCEQRITLVEKEYDITLLRLPEDHGDGFLRLTHILINDLGKVNAVKFKIEFVCDYLRTHGFTGTGSSEQQHGQAAAIGIFLRIMPVVVDLFPEIHLVDGMLQRLPLIPVHDNVFKAEIRFYLGGFLRQFRAHLIITALKKCGTGDQDILVHGCKASGICQRRLDLARSEQELCRHLQQVDVITQRIILRKQTPALLSLLRRRRRNLQFRELLLRDIAHRHFFLAQCVDQQSLAHQLCKSEIHVPQELILLLLVEGQLIEAAAGIGQNTLSGNRPQRLFHKGEIIDKKLFTVHGDCTHPVLFAELFDEKFPSASLIPKERENAYPLTVGDLHGIQLPLIRHDRIQFPVIRQHLEKADVVLIQLHGMLTKQKVDNPLVRCDNCGERHTSVYSQIKDWLQLLQSHRHISIGSCNRKLTSVIQPCCRFDGWSRQVPVFVNDLEHPCIIRLRGCQNAAGKAESGKMLKLHLFAERIERKRNPRFQRLLGPHLDKRHHLLAVRLSDTVVFPRCNGCHLCGIIPQQSPQFVTQFRRLFLSGLLVLTVPDCLRGKDMYFLLTHGMGDLQIRVKHIFISALSGRKQPLHLLKIQIHPAVDTGKQIVHILRVSAKRLPFQFPVKLVIDIHAVSSLPVVCFTVSPLPGTLPSGQRCFSPC